MTMVMTSVVTTVPNKAGVLPPRRLRLSPNEEARILKEETERRRKLRLQQVSMTILVLPISFIFMCITN